VEPQLPGVSMGKLGFFWKELQIKFLSNRPAAIVAQWLDAI
jgi:hypothetical protein